MKEVVENIKKDLEESAGRVDDLEEVTDEINKRCKGELSDLSERIADLEKKIKGMSPHAEK